MIPVQLTFNGSTADEVNERVKDYLSKIKGTRGKAGGDEAGGAQTGGQLAPAPTPPPNPGMLAPTGQGFAPLAPAVAPGGAFPAVVAPQLDPVVVGLVQRINARFDGAIAAGQPADQALGWLRSQLGPEAAAYTMDQCKQTLPRCSVPTLENIAKLMAA